MCLHSLIIAIVCSWHSYLHLFLLGPFPPWHPLQQLFVPLGLHGVPYTSHVPPPVGSVGFGVVGVDGGLGDGLDEDWQYLFPLLFTHSQFGAISHWLCEMLTSSQFTPVVGDCVTGVFVGDGVVGAFVGGSVGFFVGLAVEGASVGSEVTGDFVMGGSVG